MESNTYIYGINYNNLMINPNKKRKTIFQKGVINSDISNRLFNFLKYNVEWEEGVKSHGKYFTRKAKSLVIGENTEVETIVTQTLKDITKNDNPQFNYIIYDIYLNYYENGNMYTPNHSQKFFHIS